MRFELRIASDDQSCIDDPDFEIRRALEALTHQTFIGCGGAHGPVTDINGNIIGRYYFDAGETEPSDTETNVWISRSNVREYLEYLRGRLRAECISWGELADLQGLAEHIEPGDVELLEAAGVPEFPEEEDR